jgi:unsaturated rhamnogalacturonyl hydrolase
VTGSERERLSRAAELLTHYPFELWNYGESIGFEGLLRAADLLGAGWLEGYVQGAAKAWVTEARPFRESDNTVAGHALCLCFERRQDAALIEHAIRLAHHLAERPKLGGVFAAFAQSPLKAPYSGEALSGPEAALLARPGPGIFVDCIHFDPPFFAHLGALADESWLIELAAEQALAAADMLQDDSGLFWHFLLERTGKRYAYGWGRGQGWALLGFADLLEHLPGDHPAVEPARDVFRRLAHALIEHQRPDGGWAAAVHDPDSGTESSTAAFAAAGLARGVRTGVLDGSCADAARAAWASALSDLREDGLVGDVSAAVHASTRASHYGAVPKGFMVPWGQGPLLVAAYEMAALDG